MKRTYYVDGLEKPEISHRLFRVLVSYSDTFSLIYFRYKQNERPSKTTSTIKKELGPFQLNTRITLEWPGTKILGNQQGHIYRMVTYRSCFEVIPVLEKVNSLWDWDYPMYPMDPCFYKDGVAWFSSSTHEHWNKLCLWDDENYPLAADLESIGVILD